MTMRYAPLRTLTAALAAVAILAACGGGGGSPTASMPVAPEPGPGDSGTQTPVRTTHPNAGTGPQDNLTAADLAAHWHENRNPGAALASRPGLSSPASGAPVDPGFAFRPKIGAEVTVIAEHTVSGITIGRAAAGSADQLDIDLEFDGSVGAQLQNIIRKAAKQWTNRLRAGPVHQRYSVTATTDALNCARQHGGCVALPHGDDAFTFAIYSGTAQQFGPVAAAYVAGHEIGQGLADQTDALFDINDGDCARTIRADPCSELGVAVPTGDDLTYFEGLGFTVNRDPDPEYYALGAWGEHTAAWISVTRHLAGTADRHNVHAFDDRLEAQAFVTAPDRRVRAADVAGNASWQGVLLGASLRDDGLPPVAGDAELTFRFADSAGSARFTNMRYLDAGAGSHFTGQTLTYNLTIGHDSFSAAASEGNQVTIDGAWYGADGAEAAGVLHDRSEQLIGAFMTDSQ